MGINLEIGSGCNPQPGYVHCDAFRNPDCPDALDIVCDARSIPLPDAHCASILMFGVFEHFGFFEVQEVLREVSRLLEKGGTFKFDVPDFDWFLEVYRTGIDPVTSLPIDPVRDEKWIMHAIFGGQDAPGMFHKWGWNEKRLRDFLQNKKWNFSEVRLVGRQWRDPESNHLIWECVK
jgi:predicted SAM-dependent methyltransferase